HFFSTEPPTPEIYPLSLHDALPILAASDAPAAKGVKKTGEHRHHGTVVAVDHKKGHHAITIKAQHHHKAKKKGQLAAAKTSSGRSEEHTSELQSRGHLVCRLLLEKK